VIVKFATPHASIREVMHRFGLYRAEVGFYRELGADAGIPIPRCHHAEIDSDSGEFVLVLEDMKDSRVGDPLKPAVADIETAIDHIAGFHARWWDHPRLREFDWLVYPQGPAFQARAMRLQQSFGGALAALRKKLGPTFPDVLSEACDRILADWPAFMALRMDMTPTLVHRDFHPQQMFYPSEKGGRFVVFDWQTITVACGADDVARIIAMGLTTSDRSAHQQRLVDRYHAGLVSHGVKTYSHERCVRDVRLGLTASLMTNVVAGANVDWSVFAERERETGVTFVYAVYERLAAAFEANDVLELLPGAAV